MTTISFDELQQRFGPVVTSEVYGKCIVVAGAEFDPDWESYLSDEGFDCVSLNLAGKPVVLVPLRKAVPSLKGDKLKRSLWTPVQDAFLISLWTKTPQLSISQIVKQVEARFPCRRGQAVKKRLERLRDMGTIVSRHDVSQGDGSVHGNVEVKKLEKTKDESKGDAASRWTLEDEFVLYGLLHGVRYGRNRVLAEALTSGKFEFLGRSADACLLHFSKISKDTVFLRKWREHTEENPFMEAAVVAQDRPSEPSQVSVSKVEVELKVPDELKRIAKLVIELTDRVEAFEKEFVLHKHAAGSGEAMLPIKEAQ